tara:strand:+ start:66 stop:362 length:297 start_codon:yes stop_codon:yes gene_type:complete
LINALLTSPLFSKFKIHKTNFQNSSLLEADFTESDLRNADFSHCNLAGTLFLSSILEGADFRKVINFSVDLELNYICSAKFNGDSLIGLLFKYNIIVD